MLPQTPSRNMGPTSKGREGRREEGSGEEGGKEVEREGIGGKEKGKEGGGRKGRGVERCPLSLNTGYAPDY